MSKFIDAVKAQLYPWHDRAVTGPLSALKCDCCSTAVPHDIMRRYEIGVEYKWVVEVHPEAVQFMKENIVRELRELVYGDFREKLLELERSIYSYEYNKSKDLIRDLFRETFD